MKIEFQLEYKDKAGNISNSTEFITFPAFVKEISFAGINSKSNPLETNCRILTHIFEFAPSFIDKKFHLHPELSHDPTEKTYFSNKVGRAIAVYLARKQCGAKQVYNYEFCLIQKGYSISGERPDYYCDTNGQSFALEAKGRCKSFSDNDMQKVKKQANSGPLQKDFSIASTTFKIYESTKVKFYDSEGDDKGYDFVFATALRRAYYAEVMRLLKSSFYTRSEEPKNNFYEYKPFLGSEFYTILVHKSIVENGDLLEDVGMIDEKNKFIDTDGIGLILNLGEIVKQINKE